MRKLSLCCCRVTVFAIVMDARKSEPLLLFNEKKILHASPLPWTGGRSTLHIQTNQVAVWEEPRQLRFGVLGAVVATRVGGTSSQIEVKATQNFDLALFPWFALCPAVQSWPDVEPFTILSSGTL